jgi:hypothetical protein
VNVREIYSRVSSHFSELYLEIENRIGECPIHRRVINNGDKNPSSGREVLLTDTLKDLKLGVIRAIVLRGWETSRTESRGINKAVKRTKPAARFGEARRPTPAVDYQETLRGRLISREFGLTEMH